MPGQCISLVGVDWVRGIMPRNLAICPTILLGKLWSSIVEGADQQERYLAAYVGNANVGSLRMRESRPCYPTHILGSFSRVNLENRRRSIAQLVFFLDLVEYISSMTQQSITIYAQEPLFTPIDEQFLRSMDIIILRGEPAAATIGQELDRFGPDCFAAEFYMVLNPETASQLLQMGNRLLVTTAHSHIERFLTDPSDNTKQKGKDLEAAMEKEYARYVFPFTESAEFVAFEGLNFLGTRPQEEEKPKGKGSRFGG